MNGMLDSKVIVIIGGTAGLGLSAARACVAAGARVVVVGRKQAGCEAAKAALGANGRVLRGDAAQPRTAATAIDEGLAVFGGFDGLYHVAGGSGRAYGDGPLDQITDDGWQYTLSQNLTALFHSNRAATQQFLKQQSGGSVLNMSSVLAFSPSPRYFATHAYATAKAAAIGLTRAAAAFYADRQIRFNALAPALVDTALAERATSDEKIMHYVRTKQPLDGGRVGKAADLDEAAVYFLSDASRFVTGQVLAIDGGWSITDGQLAGDDVEL